MRPKPLLERQIVEAVGGAADRRIAVDGPALVMPGAETASILRPNEFLATFDGAGCSNEVLFGLDLSRTRIAGSAPARKVGVAVAVAAVTTVTTFDRADPHDFTLG